MDLHGAEIDRPERHKGHSGWLLNNTLPIATRTDSATWALTANDDAE